MVPFRCTVKHHWSILPFTGEHLVDKEGFQALLPDHATCAIIPRSRLAGHPAPGQAMTSGPGKQRAMLVVLGRNNPSLYTVKGRPLYVHLNGLAIVLLK